MARFLTVAFLFLASVPAYAMPDYLELYRKDPFRNPNVDGCITCHMSAQGGDARNAFGQSFESANYQITPMLRAQFPDRFVYPTSRAGDALTVHFSDPGKKQVVIETAGMKNLVDVDRVAANGVPATTPTAAAREAGQDAATLRSDVRVDQDAREGAFFGSHIVNLPNGKPIKGGGADFFIGHRFTQHIRSAGLGGLFGFDSGAIVAFGFRAGISDRLSVSVARSNLFKTISLGSALQLTRQSATTPVTLQARLGVDGVRNFGLYDKDENPIDRHYSPHIQIVMTKTFSDRLSVTAVPTFAFNTREEQRIIPELARGADHNNTIALGVGTGFRFRPSMSLVGEFIPRVWGFKGELGNVPGLSKDLERISIGLQKSTFRHTFELVVSRQQTMMPAQYSFQGEDTFRIGFNIYRKLR